MTVMELIRALSSAANAKDDKVKINGKDIKDVYYGRIYTDPSDPDWDEYGLIIETEEE